MAVTVGTKQFAGGVGVIVPDRNGDDLAEIIRGLVDDITDLRTAVTTLIAECEQLAGKLDADGGVTDTDYAATFAVTALATQVVTKA